MGFHLFSSNKVEILKEQLASVLQAKPPASPFTPETVLVPSMPMQRWLSLQLADASGINCNTDFPLPAAWLWQQVSGGSEDPLNRERATWLIFDLLNSLQDHDAFHTIKAYLDDDANDIKRWQLSGRIADVFDRYQYYRPEMIRRWSKGENDGWQSMLWCALLEQIDAPHRVAVIEQFLKQLDSSHARTLPERISIFAVSSLPPLLLQAIQTMAQYMDVYFYYLSPTDAYWADLKSGKVMAKHELDCRDEAVYYEKGHELLTSWGKQGQSFQDLLLSSNVAAEYELYDQDWPDTMLADLQRNIFLTRDACAEAGEPAELNEPIEPNEPTEPTEPTEPNEPNEPNEPAEAKEPVVEAVADDSLAVHICHSPLRECQVLHDALLQALQAKPDLKPEDILVMVPEISRYAPYIEAVFSKNTEARPFIPWNLSDISVADEHPVIRTFLQLLSLPSSRFKRSEIESLLDVPEVCQRFELDNDDVGSIRTLLDALRVRWGVDAEHRAGLGLAANIENSWKQAEQRLLAGYAMGAGELWHHIAPLDVDAGSMDIMARFWSLFDALNRWRIGLQSPRQAVVWQADLGCMLDELFMQCRAEDGGDGGGDSGEADRLQEIRNALAELSEQAGHSTLSLALVKQWLQEHLAQRPAVSHYFSGGVTFCGMQPMRSLPFRHICLLGMQDAAFPGREQPLEFDRMIEQSRVCDPRKGEADRYLMLETLLCARDRLYISYTGRSIRDNSACQPSVLVDELLDVLRQHYGSTVVTEQVVHVHPMQAFSDINFVKHHAFDSYWCKLANAIGSEHAVSGGADSWPVDTVHIDDEGPEIELGRLLQFVKDPVKCFINRTLKVYLLDEDACCDDEPFSLDGLQNWEIKDRLLRDFLLHGGVDSTQLKAEAMLPHGRAADLALAEQQARIATLLDDLAVFQALQPATVAVDVQLALVGADQAGSISVRLSGQVAGYYPAYGLMRVSVSSMKGKHILPIWIEHLALCAAGLLPDGEGSRFIYADKNQKKEIAFSYLTAADARDYLAPYIAAYLEGLRRPLPVFQAASWAYAETLQSSAEKSLEPGAGEVKAMAAASKAWESSWNASGDIYNGHVQLIMRGMEGNPLEDPEFAAWSTHFYQSMLDHWSKS